MTATSSISKWRINTVFETSVILTIDHNTDTATFEHSGQSDRITASEAERRIAEFIKLKLTNKHSAWISIEKL